MALSPNEAHEIASRYPRVRRDRVPELEAICDDLNHKHPEVEWSVDQCDFDVPEEEAEFGIMPWFAVSDKRLP